jgi:hypothetical protein
MTKITKDETINAMRQIRVLLDVASKNVVALRGTLQVTHDTVHEQAARIAELEVELDKACNAMYTKDQRLKDMYVLEEESKELKRLNSVMFLRLEAHAKQRYQGTQLPQVSEFRAFAKALETLPTFDEVERSLFRKRTNRIATGIINRIKDGHTTLAIIMAQTLKEETDDKHNGATEDNTGQRSSNDAPDIKGFGQVGKYPYAS